MFKHYYHRSFIVIVLLFISAPSFSQSKSYYWDGTVKRYLIADSTEIVVDLSVDELQNFRKRGFQMKAVTHNQSQRVVLNSTNDVDKRQLRGRHNPLFKSVHNFKQRAFITDEISIKFKKSSRREYLQNKYGLKLVKSYSYGAFIYVVANWSETLNTANKIYENEKDIVEWCFPNFLSKVTLHSDPHYTDQYYLNNTGQTGGVANIDINAPEAWNITKGCSAVRVAVVDQGLESHDEFTGRLASGFTAGSLGGTGAPVNPVTNTKSHGMECAGIIGAAHDNSVGIKGIAPGVMLVPVNVFPGIDNQIVAHADIANAINWAWEASKGNVDVISCSWGGVPDSQDIRDEIFNARTQGRGGKGCVVIFSAGNDNTAVAFPANIDSVVTVGAINKSGGLWSYSNTSSGMDLVAPSGDINFNGDVWTTDRMGTAGDNTASSSSGGDYMGNFGGTSASAPQVAGVAALMLSINSGLTETQVRTILQNSATDMGTTGRDKYYGYGRLNAEVALQQVLAIPITGPSITGDQATCYTSSPTGGTTYTVTNVPVGATITWTKSSNLTEISGQGTASYKVKVATSTTTGGGWVKAQVTSNCKGFTVSRDIWLGNPAAIKIVGPANVAASQNNDYEIQRSTTSTPSFTTQGVTSYTWNVPTSSGWNCHTCVGSFIVITSGTQGVIMTGNAVNGCGTASKTYHVVVTTGGGGCPGGLCKQAFIVSPNPSSEEILVSKESTSNDAITNVTLFDSNGGLLYSVNPDASTDTRIPIKNYRNGDYFISITQGGVTQTNKVVINH